LAALASPWGREASVGRGGRFGRPPFDGPPGAVYLRGMETPPNTAIMLRLRDLAQLFNSMDPSPFVERDLDADAEEYIMSWAHELPSGRDLELVIQLSLPAAADRVAGVEDAVRRYFGARAAIKRLELGRLMRRGRLSLLVGSIFLATCLLLGQLVARSASGPVADILREGLTIAGWVAMWRPLEIYLYDWWPLFEERGRLDLLAGIRVRIVMPPFGTTFPRAEREPEENYKTAA
jgi:hypothetical protein